MMGSQIKKEQLVKKWVDIIHIIARDCCVCYFQQIDHHNEIEKRYKF